MYFMTNYIYDKDKCDIFEGMTAISSIISSIENFNSSRKIISILYNVDKRKSKYNELKYLESKSNDLGFELLGVSHTVIDKLASGKTHGGIIAICSKVDILKLSNSNQINDNGFYI